MIAFTEPSPIVGATDPITIVAPAAREVMPGTLSDASREAAPNTRERSAQRTAEFYARIFEEYSHARYEGLGHLFIG